MQIFCVFLAFVFQRVGIFTPVLWYDFCADFGALIFAQIFCADFCAQIFAQIFGAQCADSSADFCADFPQIYLQGFGASQMGVPESRKNAHKICRIIRGVPTACAGRGPHSISAALSRRHVTEHPPNASSQKECANVITAPWGPKAYFRLLQDFSIMKIREKNALRHTNL